MIDWISLSRASILSYPLRLMPRSRRAPHVHKFGGASLADSAAVRHAVDIIRRHARSPPSWWSPRWRGRPTRSSPWRSRPASASRAPSRRSSRGSASRHAEVARALLPAGRGRADVLAYIGDVFDELEALAQGLRLLRELTPRTTDSLVSRGERLSARLFAAALEAAGTQGQVRRRDRHHPHRRRASARRRPTIARTDRERPADAAAAARARHRAGRARASSAPRPTARSRRSAAAAPTSPPRCSPARSARRGSRSGRTSPGLLTADPRVVPDARVIPQLHAREAAELAYYGAKVLHPRALIPLAGRRIPVYVRPFGDPDVAPAPRSPSAWRRARFPVKALIGRRRPGAGDRHRQRHARRARHRGAHLRTRCTTARSRSRSSRRRRRSTRSASACPRRWPPRRATSLEREFAGEIGARRDRRRRGQPRAWRRSPSSGSACTARRASRPACSPRSPRREDQRRRDRAGLVGAQHLGRRRGGQAAEAQRRIHAAFQLSRIAGGGVIQPERMEVMLLGFGQIGRTLAALIGAGAPAGARRSRWPAVIDRSGFVFDPQGLEPAAARRARRGEARGGRARRRCPAARPAPPRRRSRTSRATRSPARCSSTSPPTRPRPRSSWRSRTAWTSCSPTSGRSPADGGVSEALWQTARARGRRVLHEATVGAGLPIIDTYHKLIESRRPGRPHRGAALGHARLRAERGRRRRAVLPGGARRR